MSNRTFKLIAGVLIIVLIFLRMYRLSEFMTFLGDQGRDAMIVRDIVTFKNFPAIGAPSSVGMIYLGPFYYYLIAPFLLFANFNPAGLGFGVAFLSVVGTLGASYVIFKRYGKGVSLLFVFFTTFSYPLVELSRFSWNPNLLPIFGFATVLFFDMWLKKKTILNAAIFGTCFALLIQLHYLALLIVVPIAGYLIWDTFQIKNKIENIKQMGVALGAFIFFSLPLILFDIKHDFLNAKNFIALFTEGKIETTSPYPVRVVETIQSFIRHMTQLDLNSMLSILIFVFIIAVGVAASRKLKSTFFTLNLVIVVWYMLGFALLDSARHLHYFGPIYFHFAFIVAMILSLLPSNKIRRVLLLCILSIFTFLHVQSYHFLWNTPNSQITYAREVADSFTQYISSEPIQVVTVPFTETDGHFRYFIKLAGFDVLPQESPEQASELFVMCFQECIPQDDPQWQIAAFSNKKVVEQWEVKNVTIYKIVHDETQ